MNKHIRFRAELIEGCSKVRLTRLDQSHFNKEFGSKLPMHRITDSGAHAGISFVHDGVCIFSWLGPSIKFTPATDYDDRRPRIQCFLEVTSTKSFGDSTIIPIEAWPKVKAAIEAYNKWGADK